MSASSKRMWRWLVPVAAVALIAAACGKNSSSKSTSATGHTVKISLIAPLSGDLSALGLGMKNSIDLAVNQANKAGKIKGWTIVFDPQDDTAKADVGAQVAARVSSDPAVAGVVGTLNSSVALAVQPVLDKANIVMISPANTGIALTGRDNLTNQVRPHKDYFRVATTDDIQGPFGADFAYDLGKKTAAVIHDKKAYGQGLAEAFKAEFTKKGGTALPTETVNPGDKDFSAVISKIKPQNPDMVYYGGEYPEASLLTKQMKQAGLNIPLFGGDGLVDKTYSANAGAAAEGDYASNVGAPPEQLPSAKQFISDYAAANYPQPYSAYGALTYDAANVIIAALAKVLPGKSAIDDTVRQAVITAVQGTDINGVSGHISFDNFGDTTSKVLTEYKVTNGTFTPVKTAQFK
jgi:branched-chain amino acid transport system substrate-binding protein